MGCSAVLQWLAGYLGLALVFVWSGAQWERFSFCFSGVFCWYWGSFHFGGGTGRWTGILWDLGTFLVFPNLLRSSS